LAQRLTAVPDHGSRPRRPVPPASSWRSRADAEGSAEADLAARRAARDVLAAHVVQRPVQAVAREPRGEIANDTLRNDFRAIHPQDARIELIEALDRILPTYPPDRSESAKRQLERLGVTVRTKTRVTHIEETLVRVEDANGTEEIRARTVLWAAGVLAASFGRAVAEAVGAETDRSGRIRVGPDLAIPGHPEILVVGDAAVQPWKDGRPVPGVAQGGIQGGKHAGKVILSRLRGEPVKPFHYQDRGDVAVIGRLRGVTNIGWMGPFGRQGGITAWALWLGIHIVYLIGFANRIVVSVRWAWSFLTRGRSTRLITGAPQVLPIERPEPPEPSSPSA
jgi:NADH:ubiquinone reductase (H+-translocating)